MAALPLFLLLLLPLPRLHAEAQADPQLSGGLPPPPPDKYQDDPKELDRVRSQLHDLERSLSEKDLALQDKGNAIISLQGELEILRKKESLDLDAVLKELGSKVMRLEDDLRKAELELQEFKDRAKTLEAAEALHLSKVKQLEKLVSEQKTYISKAEQALRVAESTLVRVQEEADAKDKELLKVHGGWLPPWTSIRLSELQASAADYWTKYAQPLVDTTAEQASEKASTVRKWSKPYVHNLRTHLQQRWNPVIKRSVETVSATISPHFEIAKSKIAKGYQAWKDFILPQLEKVQDVVGPQLQVAKETCRPYVEKVAGFVRPHYEQVQSVTRPYTKKVFQSYRDFLTSATTYHSQLQVSVHGRLKKVDFLSPFASNELVWFLASALLVLPIMVICLFFSSAFGPSKKPAVKAAKSHAHKKAKRTKPQPDNK